MRFHRERLERFLDTINQGADRTIKAGSVALFILVLAQIVSRLFGQPVAWAEEGARFLLIWIVLLGMAAGFRKTEPARITFFLQRMPTEMKKMGAYMYVLASTAFCLVLLVTGWQVTMQQIRGNELGSALRVPMWVVGLSLPVAGLLSILAVVESLLLRPERFGFGDERQ